MTYDTDERSASGSRPIELYTFVAPSGTYYLTSRNVDVDFGGFHYVATPMTRGSIEISQDVTGREPTVSLPISHPLVQRYCASGIPERDLVITAYRLQETSVAFVQEFSGFATGMSIDGRMAIFRVPPVLDDAMKIKLPVIRAQRTCQHRLYGADCNPGDGPSPASFQMTTNLLSQTGTTIAITNGGGKPDGWFTFGDMVQTATQERRMVLSHVGTTLVISVPFVGILPGAALDLFAGCDHLITTCRDKFVNVANYGGHPYMKTSINPFLPKGIGVIEQT